MVPKLLRASSIAFNVGQPFTFSIYSYLIGTIDTPEGFRFVAFLWGRISKQLLSLLVLVD